MKQKLRIVIDVAMVVLLLCAYNSQLARKTAHVFIGIALFVLFTVHIFINRQWFAAIFKGAYTPRRIFLTVTNLLLALAAATMIIAGILEANWKPSFSDFEGVITIRQLHTIAAYWFIPIAGIHLGLHWRMFRERICACIGRKHSTVIIMRVLAVLFVFFGAWSFVDRDMFSKMFLGFSFDYWPQERPIMLLYVQTLSIMGVFVFAAYYLLKLFAWLKTVNKKNHTEGL